MKVQKEELTLKLVSSEKIKCKVKVLGKISRLERIKEINTNLICPKGRLVFMLKCNFQ